MVVIACGLFIANHSGGQYRFCSDVVVKSKRPVNGGECMAEDTGNYRLITRADFDGVVCGALFMEKDMIDSVLFAHPREMQHGEVAVTDRDISTNLPYVAGVHLCFDHHVSETERVGPKENHVIDPDAPSAARVVYDYYGGRQGFPLVDEALIAAVDKADSADYSEEEIMAPEGWTLLNFILDGRTGLDRSNDFAISIDQLMLDMMTYCRHNPIDEIMHIPDVAERVAAYTLNEEFGELQIRRCAEVMDNVVVVDLRHEDTLYAVNRFLVYALFPDCNISVHLTNLPDVGRVEIAVGKSILDKSSGANVGSILLDYGGGGHAAVGTCQVAPADADRVCAEIVEKIKGV